VIECPVPAELNWSLTRREIAAIRAGIAGEISPSMRDLLANNPRYDDALKNRNRAQIEAVRGILKSR
jgi:hypothetical protein